MTFEEWFEKEGSKFITPYSLAMAAWDAAKEGGKETVWIVEPYENAYVKFIAWHVVKKDNGELLFEALSAGRCVEWAIENGYRIADS